MSTPANNTAVLAIWVDDCKPAPPDCAVARNYDDALRMMRRWRYSVLYLDFDLGDDGRTGLDLLRQLKAEDICPAEVLCISWNPPGRAAILAELAEKEPASRPGAGNPRREPNA